MKPYTVIVGFNPYTTSKDWIRIRRGDTRLALLVVHLLEVVNLDPLGIDHTARKPSVESCQLSAKPSSASTVWWIRAGSDQ
jgi:hypothetical protein